jgi:hypothetical protein
MQQQDSDRNGKITVLARFWPTWAGMLGLVGLCLLNGAIVRGFDATRPKVGDMIVFKSGPIDHDTWQAEIPAVGEGRDLALGDCTLNAATLAVDGGSLMIVERYASDSQGYRVHWVGARTAPGPENCGHDADLRLASIDVQRLANAAGGFGVGGKGVTLIR